MSFSFLYRTFFSFSRKKKWNENNLFLIPAPAVRGTLIGTPHPTRGRVRGEHPSLPYGWGTDASTPNPGGKPKHPHGEAQLRINIIENIKR